jgi:hypothetical protein
LCFEPAKTAADHEAENKWMGFMQWIVVKKPQIASILQNGVFIGMDDGIIKISFNNPLYADMLGEEDRKKQLEQFFAEYFKSPMKMAVGTSSEAPEAGVNAIKKKELMREALGSDIVRKAADIFNARIHDVKVGDKE